MNEKNLQIIENWIAKERALRATMQKARQTGNANDMDVLKAEWGVSL